MARRGVLLLNLGSPKSTDPKDVREYLNQFLMDKYVIDIPKIFRHILVKWIITPRRSHKSAEAYETIWTEEGSPLVNLTKRFAEKLQALVHFQYDVRWAMRYGSPSVESVMQNWDVEELLIVPLYPQYAQSSSLTAIEEALKFVPANVKPKVLKDFFQHEAFISSQAQNIQAHLDEFRPDHLLLSYHGLPENHLKKQYPEHCLQEPGCCAKVKEANRYCYRAQCFATTRAITAKLNYPPTNTSVSFQSRLGPSAWIKPYTDYVVPALVKQGVKRLSVASPSFVCDCLETLEEIQVRLREQFIECGGTDLQLIPALNDQDHWVSNFRRIISDLDISS
jgi:ferrochelatase